MKKILCIIIISLFLAIIGCTKQQTQVASIVALEVNPSIQIKILEDHTILEIQANNKEGEKIVQKLKQQKDLKKILVQYVELLVDQNDLTKDENSLLVCVDSKDHTLKKEIEILLKQTLKAKDFDASIITLEENQTINQQAKQYEISIGKASLIQHLIDSKISDEKGNVYTFQQLAPLTIHELNVLSQSKKDKVMDASTTGYLSKEQIQEIVYEHAFVQANDVKKMDIEFDVEDAKFIYDVEFEANNQEYEYEVDAKTGEILKQEGQKEIDVNQKHNYIDQEQAKQIAFDYVNVQTATNVLCEKESNDQNLYYEVTFYANDKKYEIAVDAFSGKVIEVDEEKLSTKTQTLKQEDVIQIALNYVGLKDADNIQVKKEVDDQKHYYEVTFVSEQYHYEIDIDENGQVIDIDQEILENNKITVNVSKEEAKQIAFDYVGVEQVNDLEIELDESQRYYEIEFEVDKKEYQIKVDANNRQFITIEIKDSNESYLFLIMHDKIKIHFRRDRYV